MKGLESLLPHLITVFLIWNTALIISFIAKKNIMKGIYAMAEEGKTEKEIKERKNMASKIFTIINLIIHIIALISAIIFLLFVYNPMEREAEEISSIKEATVDETFVEPTREEIKKSNKKIIEEKHKEKEIEAREDNTRAMNESIELFRKTSGDIE